jgi:uncharacterized protein YqjF (DUF2071 family)
MQWLDLAFIHFEADAAELRKLLPVGVELDLYEGKAWIGIVPFRMEGVTRRGWPAPAWLCDFPEINVRTYVTAEGKRGVWFLSLDATNPLAVWTARTFFYAPYFTARVALTETPPGGNQLFLPAGRTGILRALHAGGTRAEPGGLVCRVGDGALLPL